VDRHPYDLPLWSSEKKDAGTDDQPTIESNEHAVFAIVSVNIVEVGVE
jgi:hypothetical protein